MNTKWEESFDKRFGKAGEDKNSDSIGRDAGCDDCSACIELREEHKAFIKDQITKAQQEIAEQILQDIRFEATEFIKDQLRKKYLSESEKV